MATHIVPFSFESHEVRVIDQDGHIWAVLKDVLAAAETSTPTTVAIESIEQGLGEGFNTVIPLQTAGGIQKTTIVREEAITYLLAQSRTEKGKRLNRFIHVEVLPSIRKTGVYASPQAKPSDELKNIVTTAKMMKALATTMGLRGNQAVHSANLATKRLTGVAPLDLLGIGTHLADEQDVLLTATDIEQMYEWGRHQANIKLTEWGLQTSHRDHKNRLYYELTRKGQDAGGTYVDTGKQHSDGMMVRAIRWNKSKLERFVQAVA